MYARFGVLTLVAWTLLACPGGGPDGGIADADGPFSDGGDSGVDVPDGGFEPDLDNDGVADVRDNCPARSNPQQEDSDGDLIGDICDSCPFTPNNGQNGTFGQADCFVFSEREPNPNAATDNLLPRLGVGQAVEIHGTIEAPGDVDYFKLTNDDWLDPPREIHLLHLRAQRRSKNSLEPHIWAEGTDHLISGYPRVMREAEGEREAERDILEIMETLAIGDRQGRGGPGYDYVITVFGREPRRISPFILAEPYERVERVVAISSGELVWINGEIMSVGGRRLIDNVLVSATSMDNNPQLDPILVGAPGITASGGYQEIDNYRSSTTTAHLVMGAKGIQYQGAFVDFKKSSAATQIKIEVRDLFMEEDMSDNDSLENATEMPYWFAHRGWWDIPAPDEDWVKFWGEAGSQAIIGAANPATGGEGLVEIYRVSEAGTPERIRRSRPPDGEGTTLSMMLPESRDYFVRILYRDNESPPYRGWFRDITNAYELRGSVRPGLAAMRRLPIKGDITGNQNIGSKMNQRGEEHYWRVLITQPTRLELNTASALPDIVPYFNMYGPGGVGLFADGAPTLSVELQPNAEPYLLGIHNSNDDLAENTPALNSYEVQVTLTDL